MILKTIITLEIVYLILWIIGFILYKKEIFDKHVVKIYRNIQFIILFVIMIMYFTIYVL